MTELGRANNNHCSTKGPLLEHVHVHGLSRANTFRNTGTQTETLPSWRHLLQHTHSCQADLGTRLFASTIWIQPSTAFVSVHLKQPGLTRFSFLRHGIDQARFPYCRLVQTEVRLWRLWVVISLTSFHGARTTCSALKRLGYAPGSTLPSSAPGRRGWPRRQETRNSEGLTQAFLSFFASGLVAGCTSHVTAEAIEGR